MSDDFFAPPTFKAAEALVQLKRSLRELRPLAERGNGMELQGKPVIALAQDDSTITVRFAKRHSATPEWDTMVLKNGADLRKCVDEARKRLARWTEE
jgi:hypothetical protein